MSTVDLQSAERVINGKCKSDGYDAIICYVNMFGGVSYKLCRGKDMLEYVLSTFRQNRWPHAVVWEAEKNGFGKAALAGFETDVLNLRKTCNL